MESGFEYICIKDGKVVTPKDGFFTHPDMGQRHCLVCPWCGSMVYPRELRNGERQGNPPRV